MTVRSYLLHLPEETSKDWHRFLKEAPDCVDPERAARVARQKQERTRASGLGAGLLLQQMASDQLAGVEAGGVENQMLRFEAMELLEALRKRGVPLPLGYRTGSQGKPELTELPGSAKSPWHFNLSHSGDYVILAASTEPVGVDLQKWIPVRQGLAERFFTAAENRWLVALPERERIGGFYRLWTRKEAYGKYTGQGIGSAVSEDLSGEMQCRKKGIRFLEQTPEDGYSIAICMAEMRN